MPLYPQLIIKFAYMIDYFTLFKDNILVGGVLEVNNNNEKVNELEFTPINYLLSSQESIKNSYKWL